MTRIQGLRGVAWATTALAAMLGPPALAEPSLVVDDARDDDATQAEGERRAKAAATTHAKLELLGASTQVEPDHGVLVGARFVMDEGWHIYWDGLNDSGLPPTFTFELPPGWSVEALPWPVPTRHVASGDIVDHIYERQATFLFKVFAPKDAPIGATVPVVVRSKWLVCNEACIPERGESTWKLRVVASEKQAADEAMQRKLLMNETALLPRQLATLEGASVVARGGELRVRVPNATELVFMPDARSVRPTDMVSGVTADGETLVVALQAAAQESEDEVAPLARVGGLLGVRAGVGTPPKASVADPNTIQVHWYQFETFVEPDGAGAAKPSAEK